MVVDEYSSCWTRVTRSGLSVAGRRAANEDDHVFVDSGDPARRARRGILAAVADGMSGLAGAATASAMAVRLVAETYAAGRDPDPASDLVRAIHVANAAIHARALADPSLTGMGTTCTALLLLGDRAVYAHVGDSRIYLVREGGIAQLTRDHSVLEALPDAPQVIAGNAPPADLLTRALGVWSRVQAETADGPIPVQAGDLFLLCTDGLTKALGDAEILQVLLAYDPETAAKELVRLALERGATDNITVEVLRVEAVEPLRGGSR